MCTLDVFEAQTYGISQRKVIALSGKDGKEPGFTEFALGARHQHGQHAHQREHAHFGNQDAPEERPDHVLEAQLHHVLEEQGGKGKARHEAAQPFDLCHADDVTAPRHISAQDDAEAFQQGREEVVDGHGRCCRRAVGDVEPVDGDVSTIHDDVVADEP